MSWTRDQAVEFCRRIQPACERNFCWPALTGGLLYKLGSRKDCDVVIYRGANRGTIDQGALLASLAREVSRSTCSPSQCALTHQPSPETCSRPTQARPKVRRRKRR